MPPTSSAHLDPDDVCLHLDRLYAVAWALCGSPHDAEDLVQDTVATVLARPRVIRGGDVLAYLVTALRNTHRNRYRARMRRPVETELPAEDLIEDAGTNDPVNAILHQQVYAAIAALPDIHRDVIVAVDVAGLSYTEAAERLGVPQGTIMSRLFRARGRVAEALGDSESLAA
jgi:RNA polymerase sigma-70 factor, ECF subfamily